MTPTPLRLLAPLAAAGALTPALAHADTYTVFTCKGPAGQPLPTPGWAGDRQSDAFATNDCPAGGPIAVGLTGSGPWKGGIGAEQRFTAPAGTRIAALRLVRRTTGLAGAKGLAYYLYADAKVLDSCDAAATTCSADLDGSVEVPALDAAIVRFKAGCFESFPDECTSSGTPLRVEVPQAALTLRDAAAPSVASPSGSLASAGTGVTGTLTATWDAADVGGGLYRVLTTLDGTTTAKAIAAGDCTDLDPADADPFQFAAAAPCPPSVNGLSAAIDTTQLSNGPHTADVLVEDAAGNRTSVLGPRTFTVDNPLPPPLAGEGDANGVGADVRGVLTAAFDRGGRKALTSRYGRRVVIRGRLVDRRGKGIQGARIDVAHRLAGGRARLLKTGLKTRRDGKLTLILPLDLTARDVVLSYSARRPGPSVSSQTLKLRVVSRTGRLVTKRPGKLGRVG